MRVRPDPSASRVALELNETFMKEAISIFVFSSAGQLGYALDSYIPYMVRDCLSQAKICMYLRLKLINTQARHGHQQMVWRLAILLKGLSNSNRAVRNLKILPCIEMEDAVYTWNTSMESRSMKIVHDTPPHLIVFQAVSESFPALKTQLSFPVCRVLMLEHVCPNRVFDFVGLGAPKGSNKVMLPTETRAGN